jgi:phosphoribosyl-ATP pyrophosphohydrolase/phosphoribosyl-AMP cyclohydrolase
MVLQNLKFDERGLIPAIVQDNANGHILTLSYMNAEALALTLQTGQAHFWHQIQRRVVRHTDAAGNAHRVVDMAVDCDGDAFIIKVDPQAPACHTGAESCFHTSLNAGPAQQPGVSIVDVGSMEIGIVLSQLFDMITGLRQERPESSYTALLFNSGLDLILKKLSEQTTETMLSAKNNSKKELSTRISDLLYHLLVLMVERDVDLKDVLGQLQTRAGLPKPAPRDSRGA